MKITVLGIGAWGTALANHLAEQGSQIMFWGHDPQQVDLIRQTRTNPTYLPGIAVDPRIEPTADLQRAFQRPDMIVVALASRFVRKTLTPWRDCSAIVVSVTKGIEFDTGLTMSGVLEEILPHARVAALSGPTLALEVARGIPTAIVAASHEPHTAEIVQHAFHRPAFRVYTSNDLLGVELGGALKNVIAIAAGVGDGLGYGDNTKAALITRGMAEIRRLGTACGAQPETFAGLSGMGDLTVTCFSPLSGRGESIQAILESMVSVAEGVPTARAARQLARQHDVAAPVIEQVYAMIHEGKNVQTAVRDLISRDSKAED